MIIYVEPWLTLGSPDISHEKGKELRNLYYFRQEMIGETGYDI